MSDQPLLKTAGELLTEARLAQGLSLEVLSERTKIPVKVLSSLEMDEYHKISGPLYIKSFLRTCATDLGLDADHILDLYTRFGGEKGGSLDGDMVWSEEEVQVSRVGLPWPRILVGGGVVVILIGVILFAVRGCGGGDGTGNTTAFVNQDVPLSEVDSPEEVRRGSLLASGSDSLAATAGAMDEMTEEEGSQDPGGQTGDSGSESVVIAEEKQADPAPAKTEPVVVQKEEKEDPVQETPAAPATVSRQEEPPPRQPSSGGLPSAVSGNAGTPFADGETWPVVMRLVSDLPVQAEIRRDGETAFQTAAWSEPVALPLKDIRPGRAYGVREGLVVYWGAGDHFSLRLDRVVGVEISINGVPRDISSLRPGQEIILDDHSAASGDRR